MFVLTAATVSHKHKKAPPPLLPSPPRSCLLRRSLPLPLPLLVRSLLTGTVSLACQGPFSATVLCACAIGDGPIVCRRISDHLINTPTSNMGQQKWGRGGEDGILMRNPRPSLSVIRQVAQVTNGNGKNPTNLGPTLGYIR